MLSHPGKKSELDVELRYQGKCILPSGPHTIYNYILVKDFKSRDGAGEII